MCKSGFIPKKSYISGGTQTLLKTAELLAQEHIKFSARIGGRSSTLTVSEADRERANAIQNQVLAMRKSYVPPDKRKEKEISGNAQPDFKENSYLVSRLNPEDYAAIKPLLEAHDDIHFSCLEREGKLIFVVEKSEVQAFVQTFQEIRKQQAEKSIESEHQQKAPEQSEVPENPMSALKEDEHTEVDTNSNFLEKEKDNVRLTEEVLFLQADLAKFLAERSLSSDEWEDMAYPLFENGHLDKFKPNDKAILGYHLSEPAFYDLAHRYHNDEDIRRELALGLMEHTASEDIEFVFEDGKISGRTYYYADNLRHTLHAERTEDGYKCSFGGMERFVSFEEIGQAFIDRTHEEFEDLMYWRVLDYIRDDIPDIADETVQQLITAFDGAALHGWENGDNIPKLNRIKKALHDILGNEEQTEKAFACIAKNKYNVTFEAEKPESSIHFGLLGNGITAYDVSRTDKETNDYPTVAHISPEGVVRIYDNSLSAEDIERINEQARSAREKFMTDWNMLSPEQQFQKLLDRADISTTVNINREKLSMEQTVEKYMPFVFFGEGERPEPEAEKQVESAVESIEFIGDRNSFETIKKAAQSQSFGTTVADGDTLTVVINDNADVKDVRRLLETAQDNGVYLNAPSAKMLESRFGADFMQESHKPSVADVEIETFEHTFETSLDKAKYLINSFCEEEYRDGADFSDLHNVGLAFTTLTDDELPIQVTADLVDYKIIYEFDGEAFNTEQYDSLEDMIENGLTGLDFNDLISVPDDIVEKHMGKNKQSVDLMSDASGIEEIQRNERSDIPFWETTHAQGEQLSLFGDPEPIQQKKPEKPRSEFAKGPVVDGVQVYEALAAEIDRGTGFADGKLRVQDFYEEHNPTIQQLADFLKKEYGTGGHSCEGNISIVDYDSKGLTFSFENGEKYRHSWYNVAVMTEARLKDNTYLSAEQQEKRQAQKEEKSNHKQIPDTVEVGDRFRHKITGEVSEVVSLTGAMPFYTDDCTVTTDKGSYATTENISYDKLLNSDLYEYIGRAEPEKEKSEPDKTEVTPETEKSDIPTVKNLSQLKKTIKQGMMFEITDHNRPECVGERRVVTGVTTVDFTSRKLDENGEPIGKDLHMEFDRAKNWSFDGGELTSRLDNGDMLMSFHFIDSLERTKETYREPFFEEIGGTDDTIKYKITENADEQYKYNVQIFTQGENGDFAYSGNGKFFETLDEAHAFIEHDKSERNAEKKPDISQNTKEKIFTITDDALGEGGAKTKFRNNIAAIKLLKELEAENRQATPEEMKTLSQYVGWGGLAQAFDSGNEKWTKEFAELKGLLTTQEYTSANATVLDAFYTPPVVIDSIYAAAAKFGFDGGNVLEPSCGVGNFIGRMPEEMRQDSKIYGVELDSISGRIAKQLYPDADIQVKGFEKTDFQSDCFDMAVGNVPFGDLGFYDKEFGTKQLHDYFFAKTLDKVKEGGIVAFVTSTGTLDRENEDFRKQLSERADLIGAIRLPSGTFAKNAGTDVASDIIFLQKRSSPPEIEPEWVHQGLTENDLPINQYFADHPDMVLGEMVEGNKLYGHGTTCIPIEGADLREQLAEAVSKLSAIISDERANDVYPKIDGMTITPPENLRNYSFFEQDNNIYFKTTDRVCKARCNQKHKDFNAVKAFIGLRDTTRELLAAQEQDNPDTVIKALQEKLNAQYDAFKKKFGLLHSRVNKNRFGDDVSYNLVAALEKNYDLKRGTAERSDIFFKRTIQPPKSAEHVDTAMEALAISLAEKTIVDIGYMQLLTGETKAELLQELRGEIFPVPFAGEDTYQTAAEYLSGNIYQKLEVAEKAAANDSRFAQNVATLQEAKPPLLKAEDIDIQIGASWVSPKLFEQFMYETFGTPNERRAESIQQRITESKKRLENAPFYSRYSIQKDLNKAEAALKKAIHIEHTANEWSVKPKPTQYSALTVHEKSFSTKQRSAYQIFEDLLNLREPKCYKTVVEYTPEGYEKEKRVIDAEATKAANLKADKIKAAFKDWVFAEPERRNALVEEYNRRFNCIRPREFDGSNLTFPTMNTDICLRPHQKNAVAHALFGGNTLLAHCVGSGKTFEMIASAMESKRLGLCNKPMICVPKQLTEQVGEDFRLLYPNANILVATAADFKEENRRQLFAKIATGDFDDVIISHQQLGKIPMAKERQIEILEKQLAEITEGIKNAKEKDGKSTAPKAMERVRKSLQKQLDKLLDKPQDDTVTFEEMGIDKLIVDEDYVKSFPKFLW